MLHAIVHATDVQDRDGGLSLLATLFGKFPFLQKLLADSGYQGPIFAHGLVKILPYLKAEIIKRFGLRQGICAATQALDRRTHDRMAQPLPPSRQGLGKSQLQQPRILETRLHSPHDAKALQSLIKF